MGSSSMDVKRNHVLWHKDSLKELEEAGFPKDKAERALIATGHRDVPTAIKWLNNHRDDPNVTEHNSRQYVLFLTPKGAISDDLNEFWKASSEQCGKNVVHDSFPHITLTRFFQVEDFRVPAMLEILDQICRKFCVKKPEQLKLFHHNSHGYMALFLEESASDWINKLVKKFADKVKGTLGLSVPVHSGQFHLTLAYQFENGLQKTLEKIAKTINLDSSSQWELQVYSRDNMIANAKQIRHVKYPFEAETKEEISIIPGQHIIIDKETPTYKDWLKGCCFETGRSGIFPANFTERSHEWKCWNLHWTVPISEATSTEKVDARSFPVHEQVDLKKSVGRVARNASFCIKQQPQHSIRSSGSVSFPKNKSYPTMTTSSTLPRSLQKTESSLHSTQPTIKRRRIFIIRHAERVDITFGRSWVGQYFDESGGYHRRNLNMPKRLPLRNGGPDFFSQDSPITEIGCCQAKLTGESLFAHNIVVSKVFTSPAFRCIQTADSILEGLKLKGKVKIKAEPALYEWLAWCKGKLPRWLTNEELVAFGVNMDTKYQSFMTTDDFHLDESLDSYHHRTFNLMKWITEDLRPEDLNVLIVAHSPSLEACSRQLTGEVPRPIETFIKIVQKVPYCAVNVLEESSDGKWVLVQPPIPSLIHSNNGKMDWRMFQQENRDPCAV